MKKYYKVTCKGGHVGRSRYMPIDLYIIAESGKDAASIARFMPRVKHDHKDCILAVEEVIYEDYLFGRAENDCDPYWTSKNIQEQRLSLEIYDRTVPEKAREERDEEREYSKYPGIRNLKKYRKMRPDDNRYGYTNLRYLAG